MSLTVVTNNAVLAADEILSLFGTYLKKEAEASYENETRFIVLSSSQLSQDNIRAIEVVFSTKSYQGFRATISGRDLQDNFIVQLEEIVEKIDFKMLQSKNLNPLTVSKRKQKSFVIPDVPPEE